MYLQTLAISLAQIVVIVLLGYFISVKKILTKECFLQINNLVLSIVMPCLLINSSNTEFNREVFQNLLKCMGITAIILMASYFLCHLIFSKKIDKTKRNVGISMCVFSNACFLGLPLTVSLYGTEALLYAISFNVVFNLFMFTLGFKLLSSSAEKFSFKKFLNPMTIASILALVLFVLPFRLPSDVYYVFNLVGGMCVPLSLFLIGSWMVGVRWKNVFSNKLAYLVCFIRLLLIPGLIILVLYIFKIQLSLMLEVCILISSLPIATTNIMMSQKYGSDVEFANDSLFLSMLFSLGSLFLIMQLQNLL